mmetsp:Transcript_2497/g.6755  ORF Transcript_2497/g.6755 Transcript_2497/m.6755 type:complete len:621 (-) Transcript_2497:118-1980(-)
MPATASTNRRRISTARKRTPTKAKAPNDEKETRKRKPPDISSLPSTPPPTRTLLVDNGGDTIKYGWISEPTINGAERLERSLSPSYPHIIPNVSAKLMHQFTTLVGDELNQVQNPNSLMARTRSMERGVICNLENQTRVWKRMLDLLGVMVPTHTATAKCLGWKVAAGKKKAGKLLAAATGTGELPEKTISPQSICVILLLPPHCPRILLDQIFTIWMEDFCVSYVGLGISSACASYDQSLCTPWKTSCTIDIGWSSTLIVPTFRNNVIQGKGRIETDKIRSSASTIRRMPFGGRHMINMMRYYMSYRQYNLMDQEVLVRDIFERLAYISSDIKGELRTARMKPSGRRPFDRDFVLPDYSNSSRGEIRIPLALQRDIENEQKKRKEQLHQMTDEDHHEPEEDEDFCGDEEDDSEDDDSFSDEIEVDNVTQEKGEGRKRLDVEEKGCSESEDEESIDEKRKRLLRQRVEQERRRREQQDEEQVLRVSVERFTIPEVLFRPIDSGLQSDLVGLSHAIVQSVEACPEPYRPALYRSVYLVGGLALLPNLIKRLKCELRSLVPDEYDVNIFASDSPVDRAWMGAKSIFENEHYAKSTVSRQEWENSLKRRAYRKLLIENGGFYT